MRRRRLYINKRRNQDKDVRKRYLCRRNKRWRRGYIQTSSDKCCNPPFDWDKHDQLRSRWSIYGEEQRGEGGGGYFQWKKGNQGWGVHPVILYRVQPVKVKVNMDTFSGNESESEKGGFKEKPSCLWYFVGFNLAPPIMLLCDKNLNIICLNTTTIFWTVSPIW